MEKKEEEQSKEMVLEVNPNIEGGVYSNIANIVHNKNEVIIDFAIILPGRNSAKIQSRIITSPAHAKQLTLALKDNIDKYEERYGEIKSEPAPNFSKPPGTLH